MEGVVRLVLLWCSLMHFRDGVVPSCRVSSAIGVAHGAASSHWGVFRYHRSIRSFRFQRYLGSIATRCAWTDGCAWLDFHLFGVYPGIILAYLLGSAQSAFTRKETECETCLSCLGRKRWGVELSITFLDHSARYHNQRSCLACAPT